MNLPQILKIIVLIILAVLPFWFSIPRPLKYSCLIQDVFKTDRYRYTMTLPAGFFGEESVPLVLVLHDGGYGTPYYGKAILVDLVEPALRELGAIFIAPDCPVKDWTRTESVCYILDLLE
jgi:hypothetical protein